MATQVQVLVVGAGISGLTTAYHLLKSGLTTLVVEAAARPGGLITTAKRDGYLLECGPQSFSGNAAVTRISTELGLLSARLEADPKAPRYILIDGKLAQAPMGPGILASPFFSGGTRGALLKDIFGHSTPPEQDESVAAFVRRKFSATLLDRLVGPFVSGIYAGDPEKLSLRAAFPILHEAETLSGSVVRGALKVMKARKAARGNEPREKATLQTFADGNSYLVNALAETLGEQLYSNVEVESVTKLPLDREPKAPRFRVGLRTPSGPEAVEAERLVLAVPTDVAGRLLAPLSHQFEALLGGVEYAGVGVVSLGYRKQELANPLNGFGFLVPRSSGLSVLGTVWNSSLFAERAPHGHVLMTSFVGGATNPAALKKSPQELTALVHGEIGPLLGARNTPEFSNVTLWPRALPQYNLGHTARLEALRQLLSGFHGLYLAGNYLNGPAIGTCVEHALKVANDVRISFAN